MARDYAKVYTSIRDDEDFRMLSPGAQALYFQLIIGDITKAGTFWWRPKVFASYFGDTTVEDVEALMAELQEHIFVLVDRTTDEGLVRSHVRYDGILKSPNMVKSMVSSWRDIGSPRLRRILENEVRREVERHPGLHDLIVLPDAFKKGSENPSDLVSREFPQQNPSNNPSPNPSGKGFSGVSHTGDGRRETGYNPPATQEGGVGGTNSATTSEPSLPERGAERSSGGGDGKQSGRKRPARALPDDWEPNEKHVELARIRQLDLEQQATRFRDHAQANDRRQVDWDAAFRQWLNSPFAAKFTVPAAGQYPGGRPPKAGEIADDGTLLPPLPEPYN